MFAYNLELIFCFGQSANTDKPRKVMKIKQETFVMKSSKRK